MEKKSKILLVVLLIIVICSIYLTYKRAFVDRDFEITNSEEESLIYE